MKTAIEKPMTPGGVFDHLMEPQGDEPEFLPSKDPKTMTMQEFLEEMGRFLRWNRMTPDEKRAEQEAQRAASHATEQAAGGDLYTMEPERKPDTPQDTVWEDLTDAPQDIVRADVPNGPPDDLPDTVEGNMPDAVGALTAQEKARNGTVQGVPEVEVVPPEAIVPLGQTGEDAPAEAPGPQALRRLANENIRYNSHKYTGEKRNGENLKITLKRGIIVVRTSRV